MIHLSAGGAFLAEVILTALFVFVILSVTGRHGNTTTAGLAIGLTLTAVHLIGIPLTGTSVNPARSLGPALVVGGTALSQVWLFLVAPLVGGIVAAIVHAVLYPREADSVIVVDVASNAVESWASTRPYGAVWPRRVNLLRLGLTAPRRDRRRVGVRCERRSPSTRSSDRHAAPRSRRR